MVERWNPLEDSEDLRINGARKWNPFIGSAMDLFGGKLLKR